MYLNHRQQADVLELCGDGRHRHGNDGLIQRTQKNRHHQRDQHAANGRFGRFGVIEMGHGQNLRAVEVPQIIRRAGMLASVSR